MNQVPMQRRTVLVTGGSGGIGGAICEHLGSLGHRVAVNYANNKASAVEVASSIEAAGGNAMTVGADVSDPVAVKAMFAAVDDVFGPVEVLVNNAGITRDNLMLRMKVDQWDEVIATNLRSVYLCSKASLKGMIKARWGRIISVGSVSGIAGNPGQANYAAAKAAMMGFTKSLAKEVGSRGITANVVAPGFIKTNMTAALGEDVLAAAVSQVSVGRLGEPSDVASAVGYLSSEQAGYITGQTIVVDGGLVM